MIPCFLFRSGIVNMPFSLAGLHKADARKMNHKRQKRPKWHLLRVLGCTGILLILLWWYSFLSFIGTSTSPYLPSRDEHDMLTAMQKAVDKRDTLELKRIFQSNPKRFAGLVDQLRNAPTTASVKATDIMPHNSTQSNPQRPDGGAIVHMGKTGGSSISLLLRNGCHSYMPHPCRNVTHESMASKLIKSYYHVPDFGLLPISHHDFYLVTMRDPYERFVSAFTYEHVLNVRARKDDVAPKTMDRVAQAFRCFDSLEAFVALLEPDPFDYSYPFEKHIINTTSCVDFARAAFDGKVRIFHHLFFNYGRLRSLLPSDNVTIYATRQEYLFHDWVRVNKLLGQQDEVYIPNEMDQSQIRNLTHLNLPVTRDVSSSGQKTLCLALEREYNHYMWFLRKARNILPDDVKHSIERALKRCPELHLGQD